MGRELTSLKVRDLKLLFTDLSAVKFSYHFFRKKIYGVKIFRQVAMTMLYRPILSFSYLHLHLH